MGERASRGLPRLNILVRGTRPFRLLERRAALPYPAGVVAFLADETEELDSEPRWAAALLRQVADLLGDLEHEQLEVAQDLRLAGGVVAEAHCPVFVAEVVAQDRSRLGRQREMAGGGVVDVFLDRPRLHELGVAQLAHGAAVAVHAAFFV